VNTDSRTVITGSAEFAIEANRLTFSFDGLKALDELSLQVPRGVSFGLMGPNGAGKTTLIRLAVGLLRAQSGRINLLGRRPSREMARLTGYMPQLPSLYTELSIYQNVDFFAKVYGVKDRSERTQRVEETIRLVDMWDRRRDAVQKLSGGMRQRVSLACAVVHQPPLLFLDEPTVGLDPELRVTFWEYFNGLTHQGVTLVISSHTMDDAAHCDLLAFMRQGKVIARGTPEELRQAVARPGATLEDAFLHFVRAAPRESGA
jgi:ABC-2 type transport system ATP-binding protein